MRRLWDKFKLPHFLIFETQEPVMVKPPDLINEGQWIEWRSSLNEMKSQEPPDEEYICRATIQDRVVAFHNFLHLFPFFMFFFLAVHNSPIGDLVPWSVPWLGTTNNQSLHNTTE